MSPIIVVVTLTPHPARRDALVDVCRRYWPGVQREPGCEKFALHESSNTFLVVERWATRALWEQHLATPENAALNAELTPLLAEAAQIWDAAPIPVGDALKSTI